VERPILANAPFRPERIHTSSNLAERIAAPSPHRSIPLQREHKRLGGGDGGNVPYSSHLARNAHAHAPALADESKPELTEVIAPPRPDSAIFS